MAAKLTLSSIKEQFELENYHLISDSYTNRDQELKYECPNNHFGNTTWTRWNAGARCPKCVNKAKKNSFEKILKAFEDEGYTLLTPTYENVGQRLEFQCPQGHKASTTFRAWKQGVRCKFCDFQKRADRRRLTIEEVRLAFEKEQYILLEDKYIDCTTKMKYECPKKHLSQITWDGWQHGTRCRFCGYEKVSRDTTEITIEQVKRSFKLEGYTLLSNEFIHRLEKLKFICPRNHHSETTWGRWCQGHRCGICSTNTSQAEHDIRELFKTFNPIKSRFLVAPREIDIYFETYRAAIEFCGLHWHSYQPNSDKHKRITKDFHSTKMEGCRQQGVRLITLFEDEWKKKKDICISRIKAMLGLCSIIVNNQPPEVVQQEDAELFLVKNHIHDSLGLPLSYLGIKGSDGWDAIVEYIIQDTELRILRYTSKLDTQLQGGLSCFYPSLVEKAKISNCQIITYMSDLRWSSGNIF